MVQINYSNKINPALAKKFEADSKVAISTIIEVDVGEPMIEIGGKGKLDPRKPSASQFKISVPDIPDQRNILQQLSSHLKLLTGDEPVIIQSAGSIVVDLTGEQARKLAEKSIIKKILPNANLSPGKQGLSLNLQ